MTESMSEEWEKWLAQETSNRETIEKQLDDLSSTYGGAGDSRYREFWDHARQISEMINTVTPLPENERDQLRGRYNRICSEIKKKQDQEREIRIVQSKKVREVILAKVHEARNRAESDPDNISSLNAAQSLLSEALKWLKNGGQTSETSGEESENQLAGSSLLRDDRQMCWDKWREANDLVFSRRQIIWDQNYENVAPGTKEALEEADEGDPFQALDKVKEVQSRLKGTPLSKTQREELRDTLNSAWEIAIGKVNAIRDEKKRKYEEWLGRVEGQVDQWMSEFHANAETSEKLQSEIEALLEGIQSARSKEVGDKYREQIAEKRQKIKDIERTNRQLGERIQAAKDRIGN